MALSWWRRCVRKEGLWVGTQEKESCISNEGKQLSSEP